MKTISVWQDGEKRELTEEEGLEGEMLDSQKDYHARKIASSILRTCERRGYGLGECGYYFNEAYIELIEYGQATIKEAREIRDMAEEIAELAYDNSMTINEPYVSSFEEKRHIKKEDV